MSIDTIASLIAVGIIAGILWIFYRVFRFLKSFFSDSSEDESLASMSYVTKDDRQKSAGKRVKFAVSNLFIPVEFVPDRCDKNYSIQSLNSDSVYTTNPFRFECDCDWVQKDCVKSLEKSIPKNDIRRFCRHMVSACRRARVFSKEVDESSLPLEVQTILGDGYRHHRMRMTEIDDRRIIFAYDLDAAWVDLWLETPKKNKFNRYGFNVYEGRWSYSQSPKGLDQKIRNLIEEEIYQS